MRKIFIQTTIKGELRGFEFRDASDRVLLQTPNMQNSDTYYKVKEFAVQENERVVGIKSCLSNWDKNWL